MNPILDAASTILHFGLFGFAFLLLYMAYRGLREERRKERPNATLLKSIHRYMNFCIALAVLGIVAEIVQGYVNDNGKDDLHSAGRSLGTLAHQAFVHGGDPTKLAGRWRVTWYDTDESGGRKIWRHRDAETGQMVDYPPDIIDIEVEGSIISGTSNSSTVRKLPYWLEGRISGKNTVTLLYWSPVDLEVRNLVGTVIVQVHERRDTAATMRGWWRGYTDTNQDGTPVYSVGEVEWLKLD